MSNRTLLALSVSILVIALFAYSGLRQAERQLFPPEDAPSAVSYDEDGTAIYADLDAAFEGCRRNVARVPAPGNGPQTYKCETGNEPPDTVIFMYVLPEAP